MGKIIVKAPRLRHPVFRCSPRKAVQGENIHKLLFSCLLALGLAVCTAGQDISETIDDVDSRPQLCHASLWEHPHSHSPLRRSTSCNRGSGSIPVIISLRELLCLDWSASSGMQSRTG